MNQGAEIDSEAKKNEIEVSLNALTNHCVVIMEQGPIDLDVAAARWRISATLYIHDALSGLRIEADLPFITIRPIQHKRQIVAIAKAPLAIARWVFRFESDESRSKAQVWLLPGKSIPSDCGIFEVPHG
jgi:hypothetical protein